MEGVIWWCARKGLTSTGMLLVFKKIASLKEWLYTHCIENFEDLLQPYVGEDWEKHLYHFLVQESMTI